MTDSEREWAEAKMGTRIDVHQWTTGKTERLKGTVIDYKADTVGMGVFFVCQLDKPNKKGDLQEESYRAFPFQINDRAKTSRDIKHALSKETHRIMEERIARQKLRQDDDDDFDSVSPF